MNKFDIQYSNRYSLNCSYCRNVCIQDFIRKFQNLFDDISKLYKILFDPFTNFRKSYYQAYNGALGKYFFHSIPPPTPWKHILDFLNPIPQGVCHANNLTRGGGLILTKQHLKLSWGQINPPEWNVEQYFKGVHQ